jgi:hypothetical protein
MSDSLWQPDNKEWMAQRKKEWRQVQEVLKILGMIKKQHYPLHKELFFFGKVDPELSEPGMGGGKAFFGALCFFELWYHPVISLEAYQAIFDRQQSPNNLKLSGDLLLKYQGYEYPQEYGMLGGREELMVKTLFPSLHYDEVKEFSGQFRDKPYHLCPPSGVLFNAWVAGTRAVFRERNLNAPGQYLWEHVIHNPLRLSGGEIEAAKSFFNVIKNYEKIDQLPQSNTKGKELARQLTQRFNAGEFPEPLNRLWKEVKEL